MREIVNGPVAAIMSNKPLLSLPELGLRHVFDEPVRGYGKT